MQHVDTIRHQANSQKMAQNDDMQTLTVNSPRINLGNFCVTLLPWPSFP